jgi:hypothetical protein
MVRHGRVRVVCIRFLLQNIHRFELPQLLDMSNRLSNYCIATLDCFSLRCNLKFNLFKLELKHESKDSLGLCIFIQLSVVFDHFA